MHNIDNSKKFDVAVKVIQYNIISKIHHFWHTYDAFKKDWDYQISHNDSKSTEIFGKIWGAFHIDKDILRKIVGRSTEGRCFVQEFFDYIKDSDELRHTKKIDKVYKTGKHFSSKSYFWIPLERLQVLMSRDFCISQFDNSVQKKIRKYIMGDINSSTYVKNDNKNKVKSDIVKKESEPVVNEVKHPENDYDMGDEINEKYRNILISDVRNSLVSLNCANKISTRLGLGVTFTLKDQINGFSVTNNTIKRMIQWDKIVLDN